MMRLPGSLTYQRTNTGWGFQSQCSSLSITLFPWLHQALLTAACLHSELVWGCCYSPHGHYSHTLIPALACSQQTHLGPVPPLWEAAMAGALLVLCKSPTDSRTGCPRMCNMKESSAEQKQNCRAAPQRQCMCIQKGTISEVLVPGGLRKAAEILWTSATLIPTCRSLCGGHDTHGPCSPCWRNLVLQADVVTLSSSPHSRSIVNPLRY